MIFGSGLDALSLGQKCGALDVSDFQAFEQMIS